MKFVLCHKTVLIKTSTKLVRFPIPAAPTLVHEAAEARWLAKLVMAAAGGEKKIIKKIIGEALFFLQEVRCLFSLKSCSVLLG